MIQRYQEMLEEALWALQRAQSNQELLRAVQAALSATWSLQRHLFDLRVELEAQEGEGEWTTTRPSSASP